MQYICYSKTVKAGGFHEIPEIFREFVRSSIHSWTPDPRGASTEHGKTVSAVISTSPWKVKCPQVN